MTLMRNQKINLLEQALMAQDWRGAIAIHLQLFDRFEPKLYAQFQECVKHIIDSGDFTWIEMQSFIQCLKLNDRAPFIDKAIQSKLDPKKNNDFIMTNGEDLVNFVVRVVGDSSIVCVKGDSSIRNLYEDVKRIIENCVLINFDQNIFNQTLKLNLCNEIINSYGTAIATKKNDEIDKIVYSTTKLHTDCLHRLINIKAYDLYKFLANGEEKQKASAAITGLRQASIDKIECVVIEAEWAIDIYETFQRLQDEIKALSDKQAKWDSVKIVYQKLNKSLSELNESKYFTDKEWITPYQEFINHVTNEHEEANSVATNFKKYLDVGDLLKKNLCKEVLYSQSENNIDCAAYFRSLELKQIHQPLKQLLDSMYKHRNQK